MPILTLLLLMLHAVAPSPRHPPGPRAQEVPRLEPADCTPAPAPGERIECLVLVVWENRARPGGPVVRLPVTVYRSRAAAPAPDPIVNMAGGPGGSLQRLSPPALPFLDSRDYITLETRGTHNAVPALDCPAIVTLRGRMARGLLRGESVDSAWTSAVTACARAIAAQGVDLSAYTTRAIAADLEDLRRTMRIAQWNLYGESYSTRIMLTAMRDFPAGVRSAVLDSPLPPESRFDEVAASNVLRAWNILFDACAVDAPCAARHPRAREQFAEAIRRFQEAPRWITLDDAGSDSVLVSGELLGSTLAMLLNPGNTPVSLLVVDRVARGEVAILRPLFADAASPSTFAWGMRFLIWCADIAPFEDRGRVAGQRDPGLGLGGANFGVVPGAACDAAGIPPSPAAEGQPVRSDIPTLILSGGIDPNTPTAWARRMLPNLTHAFHIEFPSQGHVPGFSPCGSLLIDRFIREPSRPPTDPCLARDSGPAIR